MFENVVPRVVLGGSSSSSNITITLWGKKRGLCGLSVIITCTNSSPPAGSLWRGVGTVKPSTLFPAMSTSCPDNAE